MHSRQALLELRLARARSSNSPAPVHAVLPPSESFAPASANQRALSFLIERNGASDAYHIVDAVRIRGPLDISALQAAFQRCVARHGALRTGFVFEGDQLLQRVETKLAFTLPVVVLVGDLEEALACVTRFAAEPFELACAPLFRARLIRITDDDHVLCTVVHHIITDGWSQRLIWREIAAGYQAYLAEGQVKVEPTPPQFADVAFWQQQQEASGAYRESIAYWRSALDGLEALELPTDPTEHAGADISGCVAVGPGHKAARRYHFKVDAALAAEVRAVAQAHRVTPYMLLLATWLALLARLSGRDDIGVGTPVAGRARVEFERAIGYFVNTLVIRANLAGNPPFAALLEQIRARVLEGLANDAAPFERVVAELNPQRDRRGTGNPLFRQQFSLLNLPDAAITLPGLQVSRLPVSVGAAKFDLSLILTPSDRNSNGGSNGGWDGMIEADPGYSDATLARWGESYRRLLAGFVAAPATRLFELALCGDNELRALETFSQGSEPAPCKGRIFNRFIERARATPNAVAISCNGVELRYDALRVRVEQLAACLLAAGLVGPIGVCVERGPELVVAPLAVMRAGAIWVPLDPTDPRERLTELAIRAGLVAAIVDRVGASQLAGVDGLQLLPAANTQVPLASALSVASDNQLVSPLAPPDVLAADPAYLLHTSGSSGQPKGVLVAHGALENLLDSLTQQLGITAADRILARTTPTFDIAIVELLLPVTLGAQVVLATEYEACEPAALISLLGRESVSIAQATPTFWELLIENGWQGAPTLTVLSGGEPMPVSLVRSLDRRAGAVWNLYGPTETTVYSSGGKCDSSENFVTIGRPISATTIRIIDAGGHLCPVGVVGEICIGGAGVALGYWNRPELTAERFVPDNFSSLPGARLYRTGDAGRWLDDGRIEHRGRLDAQIKLHGHRIEPAEIETALLRNPAIARAVVGLDSDASRLVAWLVGVNGVARPDERELRDELRRRLPAWMLPHRVIWRERLPLRSNGKVDRAALRRIDENAASAPPADTAPRSACELAVAALWADAFGVARVGADADFFDLGGHSLLAMQLVGRVQRSFGVKIEVRAVFDEACTVALMAQAIESRSAGTGCATASAQTRSAS